MRYPPDRFEGRCEQREHRPLAIQNHKLIADSQRVKTEGVRSICLWIEATNTGFREARGRQFVDSVKEYA